MTTGDSTAAADSSSGSSSNNSANSASISNGKAAPDPPHGTPPAPVAPVLELKPLKNVMPIVPAQQVDSSSCPPSGESSPLIPSLPEGVHSAHGHVVDNDESGVENITQVHFASSSDYEHLLTPTTGV